MIQFAMAGLLLGLGVFGAVATGGLVREAVAEWRAGHRWAASAIAAIAWCVLCLTALVVVVGWYE